jgi:hypothetical protein
MHMSRYYVRDAIGGIQCVSQAAARAATSTTIVAEVAATAGAGVLICHSPQAAGSSMKQAAAAGSNRQQQAVAGSSKQ